MILPVSPRTPDVTGVIFAARDKLPRSGERWTQLRLDFPIFHSECRREILSFAHIASSQSYGREAGRGGQKDEAARLGWR